MSLVEVKTDTDVLIIQEDDSEAIVVLSPDDVETISVGEVGPPGPPGPQGPQGPASSVPGPEGPEGDVGPAGPAGPAGPQGPLGGTFPDAPSDGKVYGRSNANWSEVTGGSGGGGGGASVLVGDTPPVGAPDNSLWWESDTGILYILYNDGSSTAWVMASFAIPGPQGPQGPTGASGPPGPSGVQGPQGAASTVPGPTGPKGDKGDTGPAGPQGAASTVAGPVGPQGDPGLTGPTGPQGEKGDKGDQGEKGDTGDQGIPGPAGSGAGDVTGPAGATVDRIAVYSDVSGKTLKDGGKVIADLATQAAVNLKEDKANKGAANGYASLDASSKVPAAQLPAVTKSDVGLGNVDNTSDADKPISTATQTALDLRVRYDAAQIINAAQQEQARTNIAAAPFDAMAYNGMQINGGMEVSQELGAAGTGTNGAYICDGWRLYKSGTMNVGAAGGAITPPGYFPTTLPYLSYVAVATAQTTMGASDYVLLLQFIEGWRLARLGWGKAGAQPITLGFWTAHNRPGLYTGTVRNAVGRSYAFSYTQALSSIGQYNIIVIPGDVTGTWAIDNTLGMRITFAMACGSGGIAPSANAWLATDYFAAPGQINGVAATTDVFRITGVVVLPGIEAPPAARAPLIMRPYEQELLICQRLYQAAYGRAGGYGVVGTTAAAWFPFTVPMRAIPTITPVFTAGTTGATGVDTVNNIGFRYWGQSNVAGGSFQVALDIATKCDARL